MSKNAKKWLALVLAASLTAAFCACRSGEPDQAAPASLSSAPAPTFYMLPTPTPDPALVAEEALIRAGESRISNAGVYLEREYKKELDFDVAALLSEMLLVEQAQTGVAAAMESFDLAKRTAESADEAMKAAFDSALKKLADYLPPSAAGEPCKIDAALSLEGFTWISMLAFVRGCVQTMRAGAVVRLMEDALHIESQLKYDEEEHALSGAFYVSAQPFSALWSRASVLSEERMTGRTLYAYMATVYGDDGQRKPYADPEGAREALADITLPTQGTIRKTWYAGRDDGKRLHTGTDIIAPEDTPIYACHAGWVTCVSEGIGAGYLVNVMDERGYEFHYYHMSRLTTFLKTGDFVQQGQLVGHVGDTGNSATYHLHLAIIAPSGEYVDPYPYIVEAQKRESARN